MRNGRNVRLAVKLGVLVARLDERRRAVADRLGQVLRDALGSNQMEGELPKMVKQAVQKVDALNATTKLATARIMLQVVVALLASASQGGKKTGQRVRPFRVDLQGLGTN